MRKNADKDMTFPPQTYTAGLVLGDDAEVSVTQFVAPLEAALDIFGAGTPEVSFAADRAVLVAGAVELEVDLAETDEAGLRVGLSVTQYGPLRSDHPQAAAALLAEMLHAAIEETGALQVEWGSALIAAREFQTAVPSIRHASDTGALAACAAAAPVDDTAPAREAAPILLPRRVRPATLHRRCGTAVNAHQFKQRRAAALRMRRWENFEDFVQAEVAKLIEEPGEPLEDVFRIDAELPPDLIALQDRRPTLERRVATWTLTATIAVIGLGFTEAVAETLRALPF